MLCDHTEAGFAPRHSPPKTAVPLNYTSRHSLLSSLENAPQFTDVFHKVILCEEFSLFSMRVHVSHRIPYFPIDFPVHLLIPWRCPTLISESIDYGCHISDFPPFRCNCSQISSGLRSEHTRRLISNIFNYTLNTIICIKAFVFFTKRGICHNFVGETSFPI
eukprot:COSAG02_NODE_7274_length_3088_cov_2.456340_2_plen_162_part_00